MEKQVCTHFKYGYCKFKEHCEREHVTGECKALFACKSKVCNKRHPRVCKRFSLEKFCKFGSDCAYLHLVDTGVQVQKHLSTVDQKESHNELKIQILEEEVKTLKAQIGQLATLYTDLSDKFDEITKYNSKEMVIEKPSTDKLEEIPEAKTNKKLNVKKLKFKCDKCECTFKKEITLIKHKNTKHGSNIFYQ